MKKIIKFIVMSLLILSLVACGSETTESNNEILTLKKSSPGKTVVTVLVKYAFSIDGFEEVLEKKFPEIDLVQVGNYTSNMGINEYYARLEHDDLTDIVMTWPHGVGEEFWEDRLIDLSTLAITNRYSKKSLFDVTKGEEGKLYYLPGPAQIRGLIYNKTLFEERGWEVSNNLDEFITLCQTIEKTGVRALQLGFKNGEVLDTAFMGFDFNDSFGSPNSAKVLSDFNNGIGSFEKYASSIETFSKLVEAGVFKEEDLNIDYSDRERMLFARECAMVEDSILIGKAGFGAENSTDEFAMMPFFSSGDASDWARLYSVCYIGLNKHLQDEGNEEKFEKVLEIMDFVSTEEGQKALMADTGGMFSSLKGMEAPEMPELKAVEKALLAGRCSNFPRFVNVENELRECLRGLLTNSLTTEEVIEIMDKAKEKPPVQPENLIYGTSKEDFSLIETGSYVCDIMREKAQTEIALFLDNGKDGKFNGMGLSGRIYEGDVTYNDLVRILPDLKVGMRDMISKVEMTGESLVAVLEKGYDWGIYSYSGFYYFSGLKLSFDPFGEVGEKIISITDDKGNEIDKNKIYTVAILENSIPETYFSNAISTGVGVLTAVGEKVTDEKEIAPPKDGRFKISDRGEN